LIAEAIGPFPLFSLYFPQNNSERHRVIRRNPGPLTISTAKEQRICSLLFVIFRCFPLFPEQEKHREGPNRRQSLPHVVYVIPHICSNITDVSVCQYEKCDYSTNSREQRTSDDPPALCRALPGP